MTNELFELARRRRSCRKYTGEKIPDEIVNEILKVTLLAPSSWGGHPIEFVVGATSRRFKKSPVANELAHRRCCRLTLRLSSWRTRRDLSCGLRTPPLPRRTFCLRRNNSMSARVGFTCETAQVNAFQPTKKFANFWACPTIFRS